MPPSTPIASAATQIARPLPAPSAILRPDNGAPLSRVPRLSTAFGRLRGTECSLFPFHAGDVLAVVEQPAGVKPGGNPGGEWGGDQAWSAAAAAFADRPACRRRRAAAAGGRLYRLLRLHAALAAEPVGRAGARRGDLRDQRRRALRHARHLPGREVEARPVPAQPRQGSRRDRGPAVLPTSGHRSARDLPRRLARPLGPAHARRRQHDYPAAGPADLSLARAVAAPQGAGNHAGLVARSPALETGDPDPLSEQ